ncbi:MAG: hypothetical protein Kow0069_01110 [Promethearchaeota archaeon]
MSNRPDEGDGEERGEGESAAGARVREGPRPQEKEWEVLVKAFHALSKIEEEVNASTELTPEEARRKALFLEKLQKGITKLREQVRRQAVKG